jgi:hypothetical protein
MPALNIENKSSPPGQYPFPTFQSKIPKPEDLVVLSQPLLNATMHIGELLKGSDIEWALAGDAAEIISGVNLEADHLTILTSKEDCEKISQRLVQYQKSPIGTVEKKLARSAEVESRHYPVMVRGNMAEFNIDTVKLNVVGNLQIKVGEWDWGDPLEFDPDIVNVGGLQIPVVPLKLKNELYKGLGWIDRVRKIHEATMRAHHRVGPNVVQSQE